MKTYQKFLFWMAMLIIAVLSFSIDITATPKYKGHAKQEAKFRQRKAYNLEEQSRIQSKNTIKTKVWKPSRKR